MRQSFTSYSNIQKQNYQKSNLSKKSSTFSYKLLSTSQILKPTQLSITIQKTFSQKPIFLSHPNLPTFVQP